MSNYVHTGHEGDVGVYGLGQFAPSALPTPGSAASTPATRYAANMTYIRAAVRRRPLVGDFLDVWNIWAPYLDSLSNAQLIALSQIAADQYYFAQNDATADFVAVLLLMFQRKGIAFESFRTPYGFPGVATPTARPLPVPGVATPVIARKLAGLFGY